VFDERPVVSSERSGGGATEVERHGKVVDLEWKVRTLGSQQGVLEMDRSDAQMDGRKRTMQYTTIGGMLHCVLRKGAIQYHTIGVILHSVPGRGDIQCHTTRCIDQSVVFETADETGKKNKPHLNYTTQYTR
jgi:hypothetical protein